MLALDCVLLTVAAAAQNPQRSNDAPSAIQGAALMLAITAALRILTTRVWTTITGC
jgi:hypothetical protein